MPTTVRLTVPTPRRLEATSDPWQAALDYDQLRLLALGVEPSDIRARAMVALARSDAPSRVRDLETVLGDAATAVRLRYLAAQLLGHIDDDSARHALHTALATPDPRLVGAIAQSLGRIGGRVAFEAVHEASARLTGVALVQARFALRLLAHRLDLDLPEWPGEEVVLLPVPGDEGHRLNVSRASAIQAQIASRSLARAPFGLELNELTAHEIRCADARSMVLLDRGLGATPDLRALFSRKRVAGLVGRAEESGLYSASLVVLTRPVEGGLALVISAYQPNGTLVLTGSATRRDEGLAFELRSVARRGGFAAQVDGTLVGGAIAFSTARTGGVLHHVGRPARAPHSRVRFGTAIA